MSLLCITATGQTPNYYWDGNTLRTFVADSSLVLLELDAADQPELARLEASRDLKAVRRNDRVAQYILPAKAEALASLASRKIRLRSPSIQIPGLSGTSFITDELTVRFEQEPDIAAFARKYDLEPVEKTAYGAWLFRLRKREEALAVANAIKEREKVVWSCPNFVNLLTKFNDPLYPDQYYLNNTGQFGGTFGIDINAPEAWDITLGCANVRVAVIDDGVDNHEDLAGRVLGGFTAGANNTGGAPTIACNGHGVACAGIVAATHNNSLGIRGVAPNSQIVPINIFPQSAKH